MTEIGLARPVRVLLVEDDDGDALLVDELFADADLEVDLVRARTVADALVHLDVDCVLLDLGLPDSEGLSAVERILALPNAPALVVLTGLTGTDMGVTALAAGAQDFLVKHDVDPDTLARSVRYAVQRRLLDVQARTIYRSEIRAVETARLEHALLPTPSVVDPRLAVHVGYLPGGNGLLGGDFYDVVERPDGTVMCIVGDVAGHGPDEAALGATLRTAWRTLVLAELPEEQILPLVERVLTNERARPETFTTLCQVVVAADRASASLYLAGHHSPIMLGETSRAIEAECRGPALGIPVDLAWRAQHVELGEAWWLMLYTDGLLEATLLDQASGADRATATERGAEPRGAARLGLEGLLEAVDAEFRLGTEGFVGRLLHHVRDAHGGRLVDDAAVLLLGWAGPSGDGGGQRSATLADSAEWS
ncbi:PP2C family protein-serine/threonine phosphatase [Sanguibacter antarcticus]|uniref:Response regulator receiver domain-containing protein n=1 Tax=Sanguibacter antarcticus TaxID=372484 RepID=A0A2A9E5N7_9MICO|nr:SpoIIE family protein phosphatase [Sanguibacter antarcticus]PFG33480.1 response regulator receiver domain-containing protein [Sanguibacter antarcticus]